MSVNIPRIPVSWNDELPDNRFLAIYVTPGRNDAWAQPYFDQGEAIRLASSQAASRHPARYEYDEIRNMWQEVVPGYRVDCKRRVVDGVVGHALGSGFNWEETTHVCERCDATPDGSSLPQFTGVCGGGNVVDAHAGGDSQRLLGVEYFRAGSVIINDSGNLARIDHVIRTRDEIRIGLTSQDGGQGTLTVKLGGRGQSMR